MQAEDKQPPFVQGFSHTPKMGFGDFFRRQMPECIDHVEHGIDFLFHGKVGHVAHIGRFGKPGSLQTGIAVINRLLVQVVSSDFVSRLSELNHQTARTAGRFEKPLDGPF